MNKEQNEQEKSGSLGGVWPALITPLDEDKNPDFTVFRKLIDQLTAARLDGLYILGSTGQGVLFSEEIRMEIAEKAIAFNQGRLPLIVQVGSTTTASSVRLAKHAAKAGADGISAVGPIYYQTSASNMGVSLDHYRAIATASDLPFYPYQLGENGFREGISRFMNSLMTIPNVAGMKVTTDNLLELRSMANHANGKLTLFSGSDPLLCHAALSGADGAIGTFYNLWGPECKMVRSRFLEGNVRLAIDFMQIFHEMIVRVIPNVWSFLRQAIMYRYGLDVGMPIHPLGNQDTFWEEEEIKQIVDRIIEVANDKK